MNFEIVIGLDLGGTMIRVAAHNRRGELLAFQETEIGYESAEYLAELKKLIERVIDISGRSNLVGIGIGASGPVDPVLGVINNPYTLPSLENVNISQILQDWFEVDVTLENDTDMAALGEYWKGAGQNVRSIYAITVGTGIGTSLILDGSI